MLSQRLKFKIPKLEVIVFISGGIIMILELGASRILAPYLGTSLYVWSALMGVILGALSLGYYLGGRLADKRSSFALLARIILGASLNIAVMGFLKTFVVQASALQGVAWGSILACLLLFAPPSILLGMIMPYAIKLKLKDTQNTGKVAGTLYAFSTLGSITGTFLAGFILIPRISMTKIIFALSGVLFLTSLFCYRHNFSKNILPALLIIFLWPLTLLSEKNSKYLLDANTAYSSIQVYQYLDQDGNLVRELGLNGERSSAIYLNKEDNTVYEYIKYYHLDKFFNKNIRKALLIGGGAGTVVKDYLKRNPQAEIDVVELDPLVTKVAQKYFDLNDNERVHYYHDDGRIFINNSQQKYDAIYIDVFRSRFYVPWHLTTQESFQEINRILNDKGVVIMNLNASIQGKDSVFFGAEYKTLKTIFPQVFVFALAGDNYQAMQNIILVGVKDENFSLEQNLKKTKNIEFKEYLDKLYVVTQDDFKNAVLLTDDFAPVDYYALSSLN